jgi:DNA-binding Lrp family transcriptional regulator
MDKTDVNLSMLLLVNSRTPYRELADRLSLSANAVHKRIQSLISQGMIRKFTTKISLLALGAVTVLLYGTSEAESLGKLHEKVSKQGSIYWLTLGGGNFVILGAYLRSMSELESLTDYVKKEVFIPNPTVGILSTYPIGGIFSIDQSKVNLSLEKLLHSLDRQIVYALREDSRKPIADIAEEVGVTAKTVRRRLNAMISKGLIEFSIHWYPDTSNDIISTVNLKLKPDASRDVVAHVLKGYFPNLLFYYQFINIPNELFCFIWTNTMKELKEIQQRLVSEEIVASIVPNILYTGYIFDTWRDELVRPQTTPNQKSRI